LQEAYNESNTNVINHSCQTKFWEGYRTAVCELATKLHVLVHLDTKNNIDLSKTF